MAVADEINAKNQFLHSRSRWNSGIVPKPMQRRDLGRSRQDRRPRKIEMHENRPTEVEPR
jgi:hypothetical protein